MDFEKMNEIFTLEDMLEILEIEQIEDPEEQGYRGAYLVTKKGVSPETLLRSIIHHGEPGGGVNVSRSIGIVRWCLEQRSKKKDELH